MKLSVCMGYWEGDKAMAQDVAVLLADLLPAKSHIAQFIFIYRHDASPPDEAVVHHVARKFTAVHNIRCPIVGFGHPGGCNAIAFSLFRIFAKNPTFENCDAFLLLESDCVILRREWDKELWGEWEKTKEEGKLVSGFAHPGCYQNPSGNHINAAALYASKIANTISAIGRGSMAIGHDWANGPHVFPHSRNSNKFFLDYRRPTITREELFTARLGGEIPLIYHGVRDDSAILAVREEYGL